MYGNTSKTFKQTKINLSQVSAIMSIKHMESSDNDRCVSRMLHFFRLFIGNIRLIVTTLKHEFL